MGNLKILSTGRAVSRKTESSQENMGALSKKKQGTKGIQVTIKYTRNY